MASYRFSESANADLREIVSYTLKSWGAAKTITSLDGLEDMAKKLADSPKLGKACNALTEGLRSFEYQSHVIYYLEEKRGHCHSACASRAHERPAAY